MIYYIGDTHFYHANIIKYCRRPFGDVFEMNEALMQALHRVDAEQNALVHVGDFAFRLHDLYDHFGPFKYPEKNILVVGNHDRIETNKDKKLAGNWFQTVVGNRRSWRENVWVVEDKLPGKPVKVLVSHLPQTNLRGCDFNVYGHFHNNMFTQPEYPAEKEFLWVLDDPRYLNAGVEITGYMPMVLSQLIDANEEAKTKVW